MDSGLQLAWTQIITAEDYEAHMAAIGQAQAAAELTREIIQSAGLPDGGRIAIVGAGTGQMLDFLGPLLFRPFRLTCTDLNPSFLARLKERLVQHGLTALVFEDNIENAALEPEPDLLLATLVLEHIDWRLGVESLAALRPAACGIIIQQNPPGMISAVTPNRCIPPSIAKAVEIAHATLVPQEELLIAFDVLGYTQQATWAREVADGKHLLALLFVRSCEDKAPR
jgi:SAM-dependent methyltransferase